MKKVEVGSKWVAKVDLPESSGILEGAVVTVESFLYNEVTYSEDAEPAFTWFADPNLWYDHFKPFGEDVKIDITKVEDSSPNYFDYPDIDDGQYTLGDPPPKDNVNSPSHYGQGSIEAIDYIKDSLTKEEYIGYLRGNIAKYLHRWRYKNGLEDLKKAQVYLSWLIQEVDILE